MRIFILVVCLCISSVYGFAQDLSYGFRAGLNSTTILGEYEMDDNGNDLESRGYITGFHVGGGIRFNFTDALSVGVELLYNQKGTKYNYEGSSFKILETDLGNTRISTADTDMFLNISNSYIDFPLNVHYRFIRQLEVFAGLNAGFLVNTVASGELKMNDIKVNGQSVNNGDPITLELDYNYYRDDPGEGFSDEIINVTINNETVAIPRILGAYYDFDEKKRPYELLDVGIAAGLNFFFNESLYLGARVNYSLLDVTKEESDFARYEHNNGTYITRSDNDVYLSFQASIGFSF